MRVATASSASLAPPSVPAPPISGETTARTSNVNLVSYGAVALAALIAVAVPTVLAALTGNLDFAHNDAWAYSRTAIEFARTGMIKFFGWGGHSFSVSQEIMLGPLARSMRAQQLLVVVFAAGSIMAVFVLLRQHLGVRMAAFGTLIVAAFPGFGLLATSSMEDVPTLCAIVVTLLLGRVAVRRDSMLALLGAVAVGMWGFTNREQAIAAVLAVLAGAWWALPQRRKTIAALAAVTVLGVLPLEIWRRAQPNGQPPIFAFKPFHGASVCVKSFFTLGLVLLPATIMRANPSSWSRAARIAALVTAVLGAVAIGSRSGIALGNYLEMHGSYSEVLLGNRTVIPRALWLVIQVASWAGGVLLAATLAGRARRIDSMLLVFGLLTVLGTVFEAFVGEPVFDRFLLPLVPVGVIILLTPEALAVRPARFAAARVSLAALLALSLTLTVNGLAFDAARWNGGNRLVRAGINVGAIDAGFDWLGFHSVVPGSPYAPVRRGLPGYATLFPHAPECYVMTASPVMNLGRIVRRFTYRTFLAFGTSQLFVYDTGRCAGGRAS